MTDHCRPRDETVDRFVALVQALGASPGRRPHLHFHCRGGKGRTATFLCVLDLLGNAARLPLSVILDRQARLGGYDLRKEPEPGSTKAPFIAARRAFLERFHAYARANPGGAPQRWSDWRG